MDEIRETQEPQKQSGFGGRSILTLLACLFVFIALSGNGAVTPALNAMKTGLWSDIPATTITLISTLPSLTAIAGCLVTGAIAGKYLSWRATSVLSFAFYIGFGVVPAIVNMQDFYATLVMRAGFGLGMGMLWPLGNALVLRLYQDAKQGVVLGWGQTIQSVGGTIMQILGGALAAIQPQYCYYAYLIAALGLILSLAGIPKLPLEKPEKKEKVKIPGSAWAFIILLFLGMMFVMPILAGTSTIMAERNFGGSAFAGIVTSCYTIGGAVAGLVFGFTFKKMGKWIVPAGYILMAVSMFIVAYASSAPMLAFGLFFAAFNFVQIRPAVYSLVGASVTPAQMASMIGITTAMFNLGTFLATYYMKACNAIFLGGADSVVFPIICSGVLYAVMAIIVAIVFFVKKSKFEAKSE